MADTKASALTTIASLAGGDLFYVVDDPGGTPLSRAITFTNVQGSITGTGTVTSGTWSSDVAADTIDAITEIAAALKSGSDGTLVTGTAGTDQNLIEWDANGDAIDSGLATADVAVASDLVGQQTIWVPAGAITPTTTNGAASTQEELATNDVMVDYLAFDDSTRENACFGVQMPKGWNVSTLIFQFVWKCGVTTGNVIWGIEAVSFANDDALDTAFGTAQEVTDGAGSAADDCLISAETSALTVAGSPAADGEEFVMFKVYRDAADGSDTLSGDAELLGVKVHYTTDALTDD